MIGVCFWSLREICPVVAFITLYCNNFLTEIKEKHFIYIFCTKPSDLPLTNTRKMAGSNLFFFFDRRSVQFIFLPWPWVGLSGLRVFVAWIVQSCCCWHPGDHLGGWLSWHACCGHLELGACCIAWCSPYRLSSHACPCCWVDLESTGLPSSLLTCGMRAVSWRKDSASLGSFITWAEGSHK